MLFKRLLILTSLFALRLINLGQSFWLDEAITVQKAKTMGFWQLVKDFSPWDFHPPIHYWIVKIFGMVFGFNEMSARLPSLLAVIIIAFILYKMAGWWASALWLANPLVLYYSQEARMYMLVCMFLVLTWYGLDRKKHWVWLTVFLALCTFYGSIFFLLALLIIYWRDRNKILIGMALAGLVLSPLVFEQWKNSRLTLGEVKNWSLVLGRVEIKNMVLIPLKFFTGRVNFEPKWLYLLLGGIWAGFCTILGLLRSKKVLIVAPLLVAILVSFIAPMLQYFRFIYLVPVFVVGFSRYSNKIKTFLLFGFLCWNLLYIFSEKDWREDWKGIAAFLPAKSVVYMSENFGDPLAYYRDDVKVVDLQKTVITPGVVFATNYGTNIMGINYQERMQKNGCVEMQEVNFRGIRLDQWSCI